METVRKDGEKRWRETTWVVMPFVDLWQEYTRAAAEDILQQTMQPSGLLLVSNGSREEEKELAWRWVREREDRREQTGREKGSGWMEVMLWHYAPALTLSEVWNAGLAAAWEAGAERALVVNNDLRLPHQLLEHLHRAMDETDALFVSAMNVGEQFVQDGRWDEQASVPYPDLSMRGGPDYSCFLISKEGHQRFPFDPQFTYCNDLDHHRRVMLAGEGLRIFSVCVPYLHFASQTVKAHPELLEVAGLHRRRYEAKWGGPVNEERWMEPYAHVPALQTVTTPALQEQNRLGKCCYRDHDADGNCDQHPRRK